MDALQSAVAELSANFAQRMEHFEGELQKNKGSTSNPNISSLASDFASFKIFTINALKTLQDQLDIFAQSMDHLEMRSRRKILLIHGLPEQNQEDTATVVRGVVCNKLKLSEFRVEDISRCHRLGKPESKKARPILFKLVNDAVRRKIWLAKTQLKGTGVTLSEFLTKARHNLFMSARKLVGVSKCWTRDGTIFVLDAEGSRQRINQQRDLDGIVTTEREDPLLTVTSKEPTKPRRAAVKK